MDEQEHISVVEGDVAVIERNIPQKKDRFLPISILVAAVLIAGAIVFSIFYRPGGAAPAGGTATGNTGAPVAAGTTSSSTAAAMALGPRDVILGNANAPVTLVEYGDYQCPFCGQYFTTIQPVIESQYINSGQVKMVFRNFPFLGAESTAAAQAAECAVDGNKFWAYHDALYQAKVNDVARGGSEDDGFFTNAVFIELASQVGLDVPTFTSCIDSNKYASLVATDYSAAQAVGVDSTPTTFVDGVEVADSGGNSVGANQSAILAAIASALAAK